MSRKVSVAIKMLALSLALVFGVAFLGERAGEKDKGDSIYIIQTSDEGRCCTIIDNRMGTTINITVYAEDAEKVARRCFEEIDRLDSDLLTSQVISAEGRYKKGEPVRISGELFEVLDDALDVCRDSEGALDITIEPVNRLWGIDSKYGEFKVPEREKLYEALKAVGYEKLKLDEENTTITFMEEDMGLAIGAVGKGYGLDAVRDILKESNVKGACISIGGSVLVYGSKNTDESFTIGIRDPFGSENDMLGHIGFGKNEDVCISTSGDYEKNVSVDGMTYHHIFDRNTGYPADSGLKSVSVVCDSGIDSDALSTACFVLGRERSKVLLEKYDAEAIFVSADGEVYVTDGLADRFCRS